MGRHGRRVCMVLSVLVALTLVASPAWAGLEFKIDISPNTPVETGWVGVDGNNRHDNGTAVDLGGGVSVGCPGWGQMTTGDRGTANTPGYNPDLFRDFGESSKATGVVFLEMRGLPAADYLVTVVSGDTVWAEVPDWMLVNGTSLPLPGYLKTRPNIEAQSASLVVTLGAGGAVSLAEDPAGGKGKIAGFMVQELVPPVEPVSEPSGLGLLGLALLGVRRKRS